MLRIRRLTQLLIALCASAFISAFISLIIYRVLAITSFSSLSSTQSNVLTGINNANDLNFLKKTCTILVSAATELRTGGAFLASWGLGFVLVWSALLGGVAFMLYRQLPHAHRIPAATESENIIDRAMMAKLELWKVFWGFYIFLSSLLFFIISRVLQSLTDAGVIQSRSLLTVIAMPMAMSIPVTIYFISAILVWRSAKNTSRVWCGHLAKGVVIVFTVIPLLRSLYVVRVLF